MSCNGGLHGALYKDFRGEWFCLLCGEQVNHKRLLIRRKESKMKICGFGNKIIVEVVKKKEREGGLIMPEEDNYSMGKVISIGSVIPCDLLSDDVELESGSLIAYQTSKARALGLSFPETYFVVEAEDVVGIILQDKENGE